MMLLLISREQVDLRCLDNVASLWRKYAKHKTGVVFYCVS